MNATQQQRAINAFADDCEITNYYFGLVDDMIQPIVDDEGDEVGTYELSNDGFHEIVQGPTCAIGALIVDLWKGGELTSDSVMMVMLHTNDGGFNDLPDEVQEILQEVYGLHHNQLNDIQSVNDRVGENNTLRWQEPKPEVMNNIYDDHISTRESLVISTLINFEQSNE
jgi:hypothetical protein